MSFFSESEDQRRMRMDRERNLEYQRRIDKERNDQIKRQKDLERRKKRKEKDLALQKEIDDEVQRLIDQNSSEKKKERLEAMTGSSLMKSAFGLSTGATGAASLSKGLRSTETRGSMMSQIKPGLNDDPESTTKIPKLSRPF